MAAPSDIFLKWENHNGALASFLYSQLEKENFLDVTIAAEGKSINVHRLVLCASSPYFENILGRFEKRAVVILQNIKFCDVQSIIEYIYKGEIYLSSNQLGSFLEAAKNLQIKGLTEGGNNPGQVQAEMPTGSELTAPNRSRPTRKAAELADDPIQAMLLETEESFNQPEEEQDVVIVDAPPRPAPDMINLDETLVEDQQEDEMETNIEENQNGDLITNSSVDSSDSDDYEEEEPDGRPLMEPAANGDRQASSLNLKCEACGRNFKNELGFKQHTSRQQVDCRTRPYLRCALCGVCEDGLARLRHHFSRVHRNVECTQIHSHTIKIKATLPKFACNTCSHPCDSLVKLCKHQETVHKVRHSFLGV